MIETTGRFIVAQTVLNMVLEDPRNEQVEGYVDMFENCREQGYRIMWWTKDDVGKTQTIAFSENRNSDDIVVYSSDDYEEHAFGYSEKFWQSAKYFRYNDFDGVVDYIYYIMGGR